MGDYERIVAIDDVAEGSYVEARAGDCPLLIAKLGGEAFAIEDRCSHADSPLHGGRLRNGRIGCPLHGAMFDVRTGRAIGSGLAPCGVRTFETRITDGWVEIDPTPIPGLPNG